MATMKKPVAKKAMAKKKMISKKPMRQAPPMMQAPPTASAPMGGPMMKKGGKIAKNGKSFPDLNKDGKITKKDILIGKGVLPKTAKKGAKMTKKCAYGCK